jgi:RHS repeat-associated protein
MKKHLLACLILLISFLGKAQVSQDKNYVLYSTFDTAVPVDNEIPSAKKQQAIQYFDGKGRIIQQTAIKAGAGTEDISIFNDYDAFNRQKKQYLAYPKLNNNGSYINNIESETASYYNSVKYDYTLNPYNQSIFDEILFTKPSEIASPGNAWNMAAGHTYKNNRYANTAADEVRFYGVGYDSGNNPLLRYYGFYQKDLLIKQVHKNENWIPADNKNNTTEIFTDLRGRRILMRNFNNSQRHDTYYVYDDHDNVVYMLPPNVDHSTLFTGGAPNYTYQNMTQVIDLSTGAAQSYLGSYGTGFITISINSDILTVDFNATFPPGMIQTQVQTDWINSSSPLPNITLGNLDCSPGLSDLIRVQIVGNMLYLTQNYSYNYATGFHETFTANIGTSNPPNALVSELNKLCYQYKYDKKNRLIQKKLPGATWQYIVYDDINRPVLTQDNKQREDDEWSFIKYDPMGRVAYSGIRTGVHLSQEAMQASTNGDITYAERSEVTAQVNGVDVSYLVYLTPSDYVVKEINYYDDYLFNPAEDPNSITLPTTGIYGDDLTTTARGLLTGKLLRAGTGNAFSTSVYMYDPKDRPVYTVRKDAYLETLDIAEAKLDFTGKVLESKTTHSKSGVITNLETFDYYTYDHAGRLLRHNQKVGNSPTELIAFNKYDELGNLLEKKVGRSNTTATVSGLLVSDGEYRKVGVNSWATGSLAGTRPVTKEGNMSFRVGNAAVNQLAVGLSYNTTSNQTNMNFCFMISNDVHPSGGKAVSILEGGTTKFVTNYYPYDELTIERLNGTIYYKKNGVLVYQSLLVTTAANMYPDAHFYSSGSNINDLVVNNYTYANAYALQTIAYKFDVRGKLTKINDPSSGTALFNMEFKYANPTAGSNGTAYYNGNVSQIYWKTANDAAGTSRYYNFTYDHLHRMTSAIFNKNTSSGTTSGFYNEILKYDKAGNISMLQRHGTSELTPTEIDYLDYSYSGNKLIAVGDSSQNAEGFNNNNINLATEFYYDDDGNMISDAHKGITSIVYDELNLPTRITFSGTNRYINFVYDAQGNKLSKMVQNGSNTTLTEYAGNYVYVKINGGTSQLQYAGQPEGYVAHNAGIFSYVYQYTDHLGNVRLSYTDANRNGSVAVGEIIEENNYYPFGLKHKGYNSLTSSLGNPYHKLGFQGQELQEDLGLNWSSFKWRNYDPALGRFFSIDPLAEKYQFMTPYQFSSNQPIHAPELEGMESAEHEDDIYQDLQYSDEIGITFWIDWPELLIEGSTNNYDSDDRLGVDDNEENIDHYDSQVDNIDDLNDYKNSFDYIPNYMRMALISEMSSIINISYTTIMEAFTISQMDGPEIGPTDIIAIGFIVTAIVIDMKMNREFITTIGHYNKPPSLPFFDSMSQRGSNNKRLSPEEREYIESKLPSERTNIEKQKLKADEKARGIRGSRQNKDKK